MLSLDLFDDAPLSDIERSITEYVNKNVEGIIRVLLDFMEPKNGLTPDDFIPTNNLGAAE